MKYIEVRNCVYSNQAHTTIDCDVLTDAHGWIPTTVDMESDSRARLVVLVSAETIGDYVPPPDPELTDAEKLVNINAAVQNMLNAEARRKGYDNIHTAAIRAALPNSPFHAEGVAFGEWMDQCFTKCYELLAQWQSGAIAEMTIDEVLAVMPPCPVA